MQCGCVPACLGVGCTVACARRREMRAPIQRWEKGFGVRKRTMHREWRRSWDHEIPILRRGGGTGKERNGRARRRGIRNLEGRGATRACHSAAQHMILRSFHGLSAKQPAKQSCPTGTSCFCLLAAARRAKVVLLASSGASASSTCTAQHSHRQLSTFTPLQQRKLVVVSYHSKLLLQDGQLCGAPDGVLLCISL